MRDDAILAITVLGFAFVVGFLFTMCLQLASIANSLRILAGV